MKETLEAKRKQQFRFVPKIRQHEESRIGNSVLVTHSQHDSTRRRQPQTLPDVTWLALH